MIEVVSSPAELATWDPDKQPFYLEVYGETRPLINMKYAEVQPSGSEDAKTIADVPIYQYWWTIGHSVAPKHVEELWSQLPDDAAARVYLYFPLNSGWRIKELVATVNYLSPVHEQVSWWDKIAEGWKNISPLVSDVSSLAQLVPNPAFAGAATVLSTIAKLQINSVPQVDGYAWSVGKVTSTTHLGVMQGVMWTLPKKMFTEMGSRLTGSVALSFIPSFKQQGTVFKDKPSFQQGQILAHAVVYGPDNSQFWAPTNVREFIELQIAPYDGGATSNI